MEENTTALDFGSIDFTPDWARKAAGVTVSAKPSRGEPARAGGPVRREQPAAGAPGRKAPDFPRGAAPAGDKRRPRQFRPQNAERQAREEPFPFEVRVLPEPKALGTIFRKIQQDFHAYKLKDLARFFLDNPATMQLRLAKPAAADGAAAAPSLKQCKACGFVAAGEEDVMRHIATDHLADYYEVKEIECEPPAGNFNCVAKCDLDGVLLGPPNIHEFNATVREQIRTAHPGMGEAEYRSHIVMVRDAEAIEEWRKGATKKTVFVAKGAGEGAPELTREQAESELRRNIAPSLFDSPKTVLVPVEAALKSPMAALRRAAERALDEERRSPYGMCAALRGAFHSRRLHFFRANDPRGQEFVCAVETKPFDAAHAIAGLAAVADFLEKHPCATKDEIAKGDAETEKHLAWLVSTGHAVSFTNGVYSAAGKHPKYGPQWRKQWIEEKSEEKSEERKDETTAELA